CHRCCLVRFGQAGIPEAGFPVPMNQNNSPAFAVRTLSPSRAGAGPMPWRLLPWHCVQFLAYTALPATAPAALFAYGFFIAVADAGALRNVDCWAYNAIPQKIAMIVKIAAETTFRALSRKID